MQPAEQPTEQASQKQEIQRIIKTFEHLKLPKPFEMT